MDAVIPPNPRDREILRRLARRIPRGDAAAHGNLGVLYYNKGMLEEALAQFQLALDLDPTLETANVNQAEALLALGDAAAAAVHCRRMLATQPRHPRALFFLATAARRLGRGREAIEALVTLLTVDPENLEALLALGHLLIEVGRHADARRAFERVLHMQAGNREARAALESLSPRTPDLRRSA